MQGIKKDFLTPEEAQVYLKQFKADRAAKKGETRIDKPCGQNKIGKSIEEQLTSLKRTQLCRKEAIKDKLKTGAVSSDRILLEMGLNDIGRIKKTLCDERNEWARRCNQNHLKN